MSGRASTPTIGASSTFSVAVMEKCCDASADGKYYIRSSSPSTEDASV
jgi:hypothetical protein